MVMQVSRAPGAPPPPKASDYPADWVPLRYVGQTDPVRYVSPEEHARIVAEGQARAASRGSSFNPVKIVNDFVEKPLGSKTPPIWTNTAEKGSEVVDSVGDIPIFGLAGPTINEIVEDPLDINTYSDPAIEFAKNTDEHLFGGALFGDINYRPEISTTADYNTDRSILGYMNPEQARMMSERDFINQRNANFLSVPTDSKTGSTSGLWDYYNAVGDSDATNAAAFKSAREEFNNQYQTPEFQDWGLPDDLISQFGGVQSAQRVEGSPYMWDVTLDGGQNYRYLPKALTYGLLGDMDPTTTPDVFDDQGNLVTAGTSSDTPGQTAIYGSGVDWGLGDRVTLRPDMISGLDHLSVGDQSYGIMDRDGLNQGFFFTPEELANFNLQTGARQNSYTIPEVDGGIAGDLAPILKIGGALAAPFTGGASLWLSTLGAGLSATQNQVTADQLRAAGYSVDSSALHRGHAMDAVQAAGPLTQPYLKDFWGSMGVENANLMAGLTAGTQGVVTGAIGDPEHRGQGAFYGGLSSGLGAAATSFLSPYAGGNDDPMGSLFNSQLSQQFSDQFRSGAFKSYYDNLNQRMGGLDPNLDLSDPNQYAQALGDINQTEADPNAYMPTSGELNDYYDRASNLAYDYTPRYDQMFQRGDPRGWGLPGIETQGEANEMTNSSYLANVEQLKTLLYNQNAARSGMFGAGGAGGLSSLGSGGIGSMGFNRPA